MVVRNFNLNSKSLYLKTWTPSLKIITKKNRHILAAVLMVILQAFEHLPISIDDGGMHLRCSTMEKFQHSKPLDIGSGI